MLDGLAVASEELTRRAIAHALIGAAAMAARGIVRSTDDLDLLVTDRAVLRTAFWAPVAQHGFTVECREGDDADPLAGVVRLTRPPARAIDIVVGRHAWQAALVERAVLARVGTVEIKVASAADLVLLKLYAGSAQDLRDAEALLDTGDRARISADVERVIDRLPKEAREAWSALQRARMSLR
jgi:hypothetical protein